MALTAQERLYRGLVSLFVGGVLVAQAATVPFTAVRNDVIANRLYPIVAYDMYREPHDEGERVDASWTLEAVQANGKAIELTCDMLKMSIWDWKRILRFASQGDQANGIIPLKELVRQRAPGAEEYTELRVSSLPIRVTRNGPETIPSKVLITIPLVHKETGTP